MLNELQTASADLAEKSILGEISTREWELGVIELTDKWFAFLYETVGVGLPESTHLDIKYYVRAHHQDWVVMKDEYTALVYIVRQFGKTVGSPF